MPLPSHGPTPLWACSEDPKRTLTDRSALVGEVRSVHLFDLELKGDRTRRPLSAATMQDLLMSFLPGRFLPPVTASRGEPSSQECSRPRLGTMPRRSREADPCTYLLQ